MINKEILNNSAFYVKKFHDKLDFFGRGFREIKTKEEALRIADFSCKYLMADDPKFLRILRETEEEISQLGKRRLSKIARFPFSMILGTTEIYHAKPGVWADALDDAEQFWLEAEAGELQLNNRNIIVGHEGDYAIKHDKMVFDQRSGKVIGLDLKAKKGG